jgi:glutathione peroxidase
MTTVHDFTAQDITGATIPLSTYQGKVLLIVNTASKCGYTPQYEGLQRLQKDLADRGFTVLGFPCNQFGYQEPGDAVEIASFCKLTYDVTFPLFSKIDVNGSNAHPLFRWLKKEAKRLLGSESIKWSFTKFLLDRSGRVVRRYAPTDTPEALRADIEKLL